MLLPQFCSRWKVWSKYEIRGAHGSGGVGNGRNRDFGAPDSQPASQATGQPASQPVIENPMEIYWKSIEIYWKSIGIYWKSKEIHWESIAIY